MIAEPNSADSVRPLPPPPADRSAGPARAALRFTLDGGEALEGRLAQICKTVTAGLCGLIPAHRLQAVLLGGGYGRGEGGVLRTSGGERPYNDLEFYVCLRGNRHLNTWRYHLPLEVLGELLAPMAGVDIEFKIISLAELRHGGVSMFSYDLVMGHRWLLGHGGLIFGLAHHRIAENFPAAEGTRLLMNRCTGLLLAQERLGRGEFTAADADFVRRNIAKAELAFGDAVLAAHGQYHWSVRERHRRLLRLVPARPLGWLEEVRSRHAAGLKFKLHPVRSTAPRAALLARQAAVAALGLKVWLWHEQRRLGVRFASARDYAGSRLDPCPETRPHRNLLVNLKISGLWSLFTSDPRRHPRERALRTLCLLLWEPSALKLASPPDTPTASRRAAPGPFADRVAAYRALWQQVN